MSDGTHDADFMLSQSIPSSWGNPMWDEQDVAAGGVLPGEGQLLYGLVRALRPMVVLEIGTSHGWSTLHLAAGCRDNGQGIVHTVEIHEGRRLDATRNIAQAGLTSWVHQYGEIPGLDHIDLAFLDAGHKVEDVQAYLRIVEPVIGDGLVLVHDAMYQNHVRAAIEGSDWSIIMLPCTSYAGLAMLSKARGEHGDCGTH